MKHWQARWSAAQPRRVGTRPRSVPLRLEVLEDRCVPAVITVTTAADDITPNDGSVSLREAITAINAGNNLGDPNIISQSPGAFGANDTINFKITGAGVKTISLGSSLPTIIKPLTIDGYTQGVASTNTLANSDNAVILIQLAGGGPGASVNGLTLGAGSAGSTIRGLDIVNFSGNGLVVQSNGNTIIGNFVGVDPTGTKRQPNGTFPNSGDGIRVENASNNTIGGTSPADRNIVSGNAIDGIHIIGDLIKPATGNMIRGNFVGVAADGKSSVGNRTEPAPAPGAAEGNNLFGIEISGGNLNTVGGVVAGARNVVGLNGAGIGVDNGGQGNIIQGNYSGVGADGVTPAGNLLHGIVLRSSNGFGAPLGPPQANEPGVSFNFIGGTAAGAGNLVEFNGAAGIAVFGNPVSASGQPNLGNTIEGNSIFENGRNNPTTELGIDLTNQFTFPRDDGVTPNDSKGHGAPNAPNNFQNFPVLTSATSANGITNVTGTLRGSANSTFRIEFFANNADPAGGAPEGQQFLGFVNATTDANGAASFNAALNVSVADGRLVTATATDAIGNTSEFSAGLKVPSPLTANPARFPIGFGAGTNGVEAVVNLQANGQVVATPSPIPGWTGEIHRAVGDLNGDGVSDTVWATGAGGGPHVRIIAGGTGAILADFFAFDPSFAGGVNVAVGDVNGDGKLDVIVAAGAGGGPHVKVIDGTKLNQVQANGQIADSALLASFFAYNTGFAGGVNVAAGDVSGDGRADIITGAGAGGGPHVKVIDATKLNQVQANGQIADSALLASFFAYNTGFAGGVNVAAGDINGDGRADIITGAGAGGGPHVKVIDATKLNQVQADGQIADSALIASFFAYGSRFSGGVRVAAADVDGDGKADIITGAGAGGGPHVKVFRGADLTLLDSFFATDETFTGGVFV